MSVFCAEDLYLNRAKFVMKFLGVWVPSENATIFQKLYRIFMMSLQFLFLLFQIIYIFQVWGNLEAVSQASYLLFTQACLCFKVTVFQVNMPMLRDLLSRMNGEVFTPQTIGHEITHKIHATRIKRLLLVFMVTSQTNCGLWALKPLFDDVGSRQLPFDMWMPLIPENGGVHYYIGYAFQLLTICMSAYMYFGVDSVAFSMVIFGCAQIDIMKDKILSIKSPLDKRLQKDQNKVREESYKKLVECAIHHQAVVSFTELVEKAYHSYLLFQLTGSVGLICMSALRILVVDWKSMQFFSILTYLSVMISQLYVCCWCGHELTATSEEFHRALYKSEWFEQEMRFKRAFNFIMMRASRPMVLRAGHYIGLSRQTFVVILRMSYSYFAVLNQAQ